MCARNSKPNPSIPTIESGIRAEGRVPEQLCLWQNPLGSAAGNTTHLNRESASQPSPTIAVNLPTESSSQQRKAGFLLARRRYQRGTLIQRGKREKVWVGRWLEDELQTDGTIERIHKSEVLGSLKDFPTKRLAQRELDGRVSVVNSPTYRARPTATFNDLAEKWKMLVMVNHAESSQRSE